MLHAEPFTGARRAGQNLVGHQQDTVLVAELAQFRELQAFVQFASDLDENTKKQIARGQLLVEILKQVDSSPLEFYKQVIVIYAATNGFMDDVELIKVKEFEDGLYSYIEKTHEDNRAAACF